MENNILELIAELLLKAGAEVIIQDKYGWTNLNKVEIVKLLLEAKANLDIQTKYGEAALDIAKERGNLKPIKVIQINTNKKGGDLIQTALCEDGSIWIYANEKWTCILDNSTN